MRWLELGCALLLAGAVATQEPPGGGPQPRDPVARPAEQDPEARSPAEADPAEAPPEQRPRPESVEALFALFAAMEGLECRFEEEKHLALLALPLRSRGRLYFMRPGYLARRVEAPSEQSVTITPTELRMVDKEGEQVIDLRQAKEVRHFVTSLVRVFAGDLEQLQKAYRVAFEPASKPTEGAADGPEERARIARRWSLTLTPRERPLTEMLKSLTLRGEGEAVQGIEVVEPNGDRTVTRILAADPEREFSDEERQRWFGIEPRR